MLPNLSGLSGLSGLSLEDIGVANAPSLTVEEAVERRASDRRDQQREDRARLVDDRRPGLNRPGTPRPPKKLFDPNSRTYPPPMPMPESPPKPPPKPARGFEDFEAKDWYIYRFLQKRSDKLFEEGMMPNLIKVDIDQLARENGILLPADFYSHELPGREIVKFAVLFKDMPVAVGPGLVPLDPERFSRKACMKNMSVFAENIREMGCDNEDVRRGLEDGLTIDAEGLGYCFMYEDVLENADSDAFRVVAMFTLMGGVVTESPDFYRELALEDEWGDLKRIFETHLLYIDYACSASKNSNLASDRGAGTRLFGELMAITKQIMLRVADELDEKRRHRFLRSLYSNGFVELYSLGIAKPFWRKMDFYSRPQKGIRIDRLDGGKMRRKLFLDIDVDGL